MPLEAPATAEDTLTRHHRRIQARKAGKPEGGEAANPDAAAEAWQGAFPLQPERRVTRARHTIYRAGEDLDGIPFIYSG